MKNLIILALITAIAYMAYNDHWRDDVKSAKAAVCESDSIVDTAKDAATKATDKATKAAKEASKELAEKAAEEAANLAKK